MVKLYWIKNSELNKIKIEGFYFSIGNQLMVRRYKKKSIIKVTQTLKFVVLEEI